MSDAIDIVYTWVDDCWPGYAESLGRHAHSAHDRNPNRTRDNLDLLKYSLRSLSAHCPWIGRIFLVTAAPQIPRWLDADAKGIHIVHHDAILEPQFLPTFNSFAILSALHRIPGLSSRYLYVEDDMLFGAPVRPEDFILADGRLRLYPRLGFTQGAADAEQESLSPWNRSLAHSNALLDAAFGAARRRVVNHVPLMIEKARWEEMCERWSGDIERTRASRFRGSGNVTPEHLYPYFLLYTGRAAMEPLLRTWHTSAYVPLENTPLVSVLALWRARAAGAKFLALNDGFGANPRAAVVERTRRFLETAFPVRSRFEL